MIEIYLSENYSKDLLKAELEWIRDTASRELTYNVGRNSDSIDVYVSTLNCTQDEVQKWSSLTAFEDDILVFITENGIGCYLNGVMVNADIVLEYIEEM